jgi:hypothetical protein
MYLKVEKNVMKMEIFTMNGWRNEWVLNLVVCCIARIRKEAEILGMPGNDIALGYLSKKMHLKLFQI